MHDRIRNSYPSQRKVAGCSTRCCSGFLRDFRIDCQKWAKSFFNVRGSGLNIHGGFGTANRNRTKVHVIGRKPHQVQLGLNLCHLYQLSPFIIDQAKPMHLDRAKPSTFNGLEIHSHGCNPSISIDGGNHELSVVQRKRNTNSHGQHQAGKTSKQQVPLLESAGASRFRESCFVFCFSGHFRFVLPWRFRGRSIDRRKSRKEGCTRSREKLLANAKSPIDLRVHGERFFAWFKYWLCWYWMETRPRGLICIFLLA